MPEPRAAAKRALTRLAARLARMPLAASRPRIDGQTADREIAALAAVLALFERRVLQEPPVVVRQMYRRMVRLGASASPALHEVRPVTVAGLRSRLYVPDRGPPTGVLVYYHGGGGVIGDLDTADDGCRWLAVTSGWAVVSVDYRMGPENPFPAALDDAVAAYRAVRAGELPLGPTRVAVGGDSFGGTLAVSACRRLVASGNEVPPDGQLLIYPLTDHMSTLPSRQQFGEGFVLSTVMLRYFERWAFARPGDRAEPAASPLLAPDLSGLPPALVVTAGLDPLRDEGRALASRLAGAHRPREDAQGSRPHADLGRRVEQLELPGLTHGFGNFLGLSSAGMAAWLRLSRRWASIMSAG